MFPPSLEDFVPSNHPVRIVSNILERMNHDFLFDTYQGGGAPGYHPVMLLKLIVYAYLNNVYSSRKIETLTKENVNYMWLCGMQNPDHNTISRFRKLRLDNTLEVIVTEIADMLAKEGHISLEEVYIDGTIMEANANRYKFVWGNTIKYHKERMREKLKELYSAVQAQLGAEDENGSGEFPDENIELNPESLSQTIRELNEMTRKIKAREEEEQKSDDSGDNTLQQGGIAPGEAGEGKEGTEKKHSVKKTKYSDKTREIQRKLKYITAKWPALLEKFAEMSETLGVRKSYNTTDKSATGMKLKQDHIGNTQLKPAYNVGIATNNQIILSYEVYQTPADTNTLPDMVESLERKYKKVPEYIIADAGYGSEENYRFLEGKGIKPVVKHNFYDGVEKRRRKNPFATEFLHFNRQENYVVCPMGQRMDFIGIKTRKSTTGYETTQNMYRAKNCSGCPLRSRCHKGISDRVVEIRVSGMEVKQRVETLLKSEKGKELYEKRKTEVEPVFGNIKQNKKFTRCNLRGIEGVKIEMGLVAITHNLKKMITLGMLPKELQLT